MKCIFSCLLLLLVLNSMSQNKPDSTPYDGFIKRFNEKLDTAVWLCSYDRVAWITTDEVMLFPKEERQNLGAEWFCYEKDGTWNAVYGKFSDNKYLQAFHFRVDSTGKIERLNTVVDTSISHAYSRALQNSLIQYQSRQDSISVRFNSYVMRHQDSTITVWLLPAFTQNGIAVYGGEFSYTFNPMGDELLSKNEYLGVYRGIKPDRTKEFWLDYSNLEEPTVGAIFFVWYYKSYFDRIIIDCKNFKSTVFHDNHKDYYWVHASKQE